MFYYLKRRGLFLLLGLTIGITLFYNYRSILDYYQKTKGHSYAIGIEGFYTPNNLPESITKLISVGLTTLTENNRPQISSLIDSLSSGNNQLSHIFHLKPNIYWHNRQLLKSEDINYQIDGVKFTPLSRNALEVTLQRPYSPILSDLSRPLFLAGKLIGLGDYQVVDFVYQDGHFRLLTIKSLALSKTITFRFYSNESDLISAYKLGEVDQIEINYLPQEFNHWPQTKISQNIDTNNRYLAIFFNTQKIDNKQIRQALAYATPKTNDFHERCFGPISPNSWAYNPNVKEYLYNPARAKELFDQNKIDRLRLLVTDRNLLDQADLITKSWSQSLGVSTDISLQSQQPPEDYDAIFSFGTIPNDPDQYRYWHSTQKTNITRLNNSRIDKLLEEGRQIYDLQERKKIYLDFQRFLLEESPAIFLSFPVTYTITRS